MGTCLRCVQRCAGGVPLRRNRQHIRPTCEQWRLGDATELDELEDVDFESNYRMEDAREMVGSEPSLRTSASASGTREMEGSEPSLRTPAASGTRYMVGSEPSLRAVTFTSSISPQQLSNGEGSSTDASSSAGNRYPRQQLISTDFYQAGK